MTSAEETKTREREILERKKSPGREIKNEMSVEERKQEEDRQSLGVSSTLSPHVEKEEGANDLPTLQSTGHSEGSELTSLSDYLESVNRSSSDAGFIPNLLTILNLDNISEECCNDSDVATYFEEGLTEVTLHGDRRDFVARLLSSTEKTQDQLKEDSFDLLTFALTRPNAVTAEELEERSNGGPAVFLCLSQMLNHIQILRLRVNGNSSHIDYDLKGMSVLTFAVLTDVDPGIVLNLLQYGARFSDQLPGFAKKTVPTEQKCTGTLLNDILAELMDHKVWDFDDMTLRSDFTEIPDYIRCMCLKFLFLMRSVRNPYVTTTELAGFSALQGPLPELFVMRPIYDRLFPGCGFGRSKPPLLQHACRCAIRQRLHENWQLPDGITRLQLPKILCDYVNLLEN